MKQARESVAATYVYGVACGSRPHTQGAPAGLRGTRRLRAIDAGEGLWIVAADAPATSYSSEAIDAGLKDLDWVADRAMSHEAVVEHFTRIGSFVPMRLLTLFADDTRAATYVRHLRKAIERTRVRISGCDEWGLRAHVDARRTGPRKAPRPQGPGSTPSSGADFLLRKRDEREATKIADQEVHLAVDRLHDTVAARAREVIRKAPPLAAPGATLVLDAVLLVERRRAAGVRGAVARVAKELAARGVVVQLTGPWPAYHFVEGRP